jgi:hypothetical protein
MCWFGRRGGCGGADAGEQKNQGLECWSGRGHDGCGCGGDGGEQKNQGLECWGGRGHDGSRHARHSFLQRMSVLVLLNGESLFDCRLAGSVEKFLYRPFASVGDFLSRSTGKALSKSESLSSDKRSDSSATRGR